MSVLEKELRKQRRRRQFVENKIYIIIYIILVPILLYNVILIVQSIINPDETPKLFGVKTYVIISGSMEPELEIGDIVVVKEVENAGELQERRYYIL